MIKREEEKREIGTANEDKEAERRGGSGNDLRHLESDYYCPHGGSVI